MPEGQHPSILCKYMQIETCLFRNQSHSNQHSHSYTELYGNTHKAPLFNSMKKRLLLVDSYNWFVRCFQLSQQACTCPIVSIKIPSNLGSSHKSLPKKKMWHWLKRKCFLILWRLTFRDSAEPSLIQVLWTKICNTNNGKCICDVKKYKQKSKGTVNGEHIAHKLLRNWNDRKAKMNNVHQRKALIHR